MRRGNLVVYPWEAEVWFKEKHVVHEELNISRCLLMKDWLIAENHEAEALLLV